MDEKRKKILKSLLKLGCSVLIVAALFLILFFILNKTVGLEFKDFQNRDKIQEIIEQTGHYGKLVFILISFLQVTFIPIPGAVTILAGNYIFGIFDTFWMSLLGMLLGSCFAFWIGRLVGRPFVNWVVGDKNLVDKYLDKIKNKETVLFFFMFLLPFFPDDALCSVAGITNLSWFRFLLIQIISKPIGIIATMFFMSGEFIPFNGWGIPLLIVLSILAIVAFIISYKNADKINDYLEKAAEKISSIFNKRHHK